MSARASRARTHNICSAQIRIASHRFGSDRIVKCSIGCVRTRFAHASEEQSREQLAPFAYWPPPPPQQVHRAPYVSARAAPANGPRKTLTRSARADFTVSLLLMKTNNSESRLRARAQSSDANAKQNSSPDQRRRTKRGPKVSHAGAARCAWLARLLRRTALAAAAAAAAATGELEGDRQFRRALNGRCRGRRTCRTRPSRRCRTKSASRRRDTRSQRPAICSRAAQARACGRPRLAWLQPPLKRAAVALCFCRVASRRRRRWPQECSCNVSTSARRRPIRRPRRRQLRRLRRLGRLRRLIFGRGEAFEAPPPTTSTDANMSSVRR